MAAAGGEHGWRQLAQRHRGSVAVARAAGMRGIADAADEPCMPPQIGLFASAGLVSVACAPQ